MNTPAADHDLGDSLPRRELSKRTVWILLGLLLAWSFGLRLWHASVGLNLGRFWDERYGLANIGSLLRSGDLRPVNGFHPSLSYLPQAAVLWLSDQLHESTGQPIFAVFARQGFTSTGYFLCRLTQVMMGTLSLFVIFVIGRRMAGPTVGLLAAFLLSIVPWHIRQSVIYKPDILLVLTSLVAFYLSMRAVSRPSLGRYLAAGAAIGLALSSKFNAGPIALPLIVAALWLARQDRRHVLWLVAAGATSIAVFLALNPYVLLEPDIYRRSFARTLRDYERKGEMRGEGSHLKQLVHWLQSLLSRDFHGKVVGSFGLAGMVAATARGLRRQRGSMQTLYWVMLSSYVVGYVVIYAAATANPSAHNWLMLTPYVALSAAWMIVELWHFLASRLRWLARPRVARTAVIVFVFLLASTANSYVYEVAVPPTSSFAGRMFVNGVDDLDGRLVYSEVSIRRAIVKEGQSERAVIRRGPLDRVPVDELDVSDGEIFLLSRLDEGSSRDFYRQRLERLPPERVTTVEPALFRARGPALVLLFHPLERIGKPKKGRWLRAGSSPPTYRMEPSAGSVSGELVSMDFSLPSPGGVRAEARILTSMGDHTTIAYRVKTRHSSHTTPRFELDDETKLLLELPADYEAPEEIAFVLRRWRQGRPAMETAGGPRVEARSRKSTELP